MTKVKSHNFSASFAREVLAYLGKWELTPSEWERVESIYDKFRDPHKNLRDDKKFLRELGDTFRDFKLERFKLE